MNKAFFCAVFAGALLALASGAAAAEDPAQIERGRTLYQYWCATCHGRGPGHPGTQALDRRYQGAMPSALEDRPKLTPGVVRVFVRNGISIMPFFRKTEINDRELAEIGAYLSRNTR